MDEAAERIVGIGGFLGGICSDMSAALGKIQVNSPHDLLYTDVDDIHMAVYTDVWKDIWIF